MFEIRTGKATRLPCTVDLTTYTAIVEQQKIHILWGQQS
jgi:nitrite reductase/ring-hydroxylating ferredoxin subunit